jgi:hypothetical protein
MIVETIGITQGIPFPVDMEYRKDNPAAVQFTFHTEPNPPVWSFSRDLLIEVFEEGFAGEGDVKLHVVFSGLSIFLCSPEGEGMVLLPLGAVQSFLEASLTLLPPSRESYEWDDTIAALLEGN